VDVLRCTALRIAGIVMGVFVLTSIAIAEIYPTRPITIVVPFPPGGPTDFIARILADHMNGTLGQPVIIENVSGAGGSIGVGRVARAAPDGYTLSIGHWHTHVINAVSYKLNYDLIQDFTPVSLLAETPQWIVARKTLAANDLGELVAWLKERQGRATSGTVGSGGPDIIGLYFQKATGTSFTFVSYRGGAPLIQDLLGGQIDISFNQAAAAFAQVRDGSLKAYAVMAKTRWPLAPEVPSIDEAGVPGLYASFWHGLWAPKGTPRNVVARLNEAVRSALADESVVRRLADQGQSVLPSGQQTPDALGEKQKAEAEKWWPIMRAANITGR
jgi:tripartite-type tricarboxylate transporter receptor subunit TctC